MSRIHDDRKDMYSSREGVLTSAPNIRSIHTISQNMEKEKIDKSSFVPHTYGDSGYRDLLKRGQTQGRSIVPATPIHSMPPLLPYPMSVPIRQQRVMSGSLPSGQQHAFQTHLPVGIGGSSVPPQGSVTLSQRPLPSLKPTNISNQIQLPLNQIPGLPTILPPSVTSSRTGSPNVTSHHNLQNDVRVNSRTGILSDPHTIRGNMQAPGPGGQQQHSTQATIQVIATGSVQQPHTHIPASFLNKGGINLNATSNMLKIGVNTSHSVPSPGGSIAGSAFKIGIPGKTYSGSSSAALPGTTSISKSDLPDGRHVPSGPSGYNRFPTVALPNHHSLSSHPATTTSVTTQSTSIASDPSRGHAVGVPSYHPISGAYVFDMGIHSLHNFPHLIRPPSTTVGSLPLYPIDSQLPPSRGSGLNTSVPVVAVSSKGGSSQPDPLEPSRTEGLTIHGGTSFNIQTLYPNLQVSTYPTAFSTTTSSTTMDTSVRPSILRKRLTDAPTTFPVHPSEKELITSPKPQDSGGGGGGGIPNMGLPSRILSPNQSNDKTGENHSKPTNHSILSITSDLKNNSSNSTSTVETTTTMVTTTSTISKVSAPPMNVTNSLTNNLSCSSNIAEASPKKKPRKQLIITTEDKYGTTAPINSCTTDEDEEFLKANETMKDITPPKLTPSSQPVATTNSHLKNLFTSSSSCSSSTTTCCIDTSTTNSKLVDHKDIQLNGLIAVTTESRVSEPMKYYIFRRRPQVSILSEYKVNTKAAHNHFYRYSDVKVKDEKKTSSYDKLLNKSSLESSTGWRLYHLSSQFDDLAQLENDLCESILLCKNEIPSPSLNPDTIGVDDPEDDTMKGNSDDAQLRLLHELLQGNLQRCKHSIEQLQEAKQSMFNLLEHKQKYTDIRRQRKERTKLKKKGVS